MSKTLITGGCVGILVALGFVFPQLAELRINGSIGAGGVTLLLAGILGTLGGTWCVVHGAKKRPSTPAS